MKDASLQRGGALVEFAVVAPVAIIFLFGIIESALLVYSLHTVAEASRLGARWAMTRGGSCINTTDKIGGTAVCPSTSTSVQNYVKTQLPGLNASKVAVNTHWYTDSSHGTDCSASEAIGCVVNVQVIYDFDFTVPFVGKRTIALGSTSEMTITD